MVTNQEIADILYQIANILEMQDVAFKPQAYRRAAQTIETYSHTMAELAKEGKLEELPGVGKGIAEHIQEILDHSGISPYLARLKKSLPIKVDELFSVEGMGPKRVMLLYKKLKITDLKALESACRNNKIAMLPGFGKQSQDKILLGITFAKHAGDRMILAQALSLADEIIAELKHTPGVSAITFAGSLRRKKETVGDIDLLVTTKKPKEIMEAFLHNPRVKRVIAKGPTKSAVTFSAGVNCDLRVLPPNQWGSALMYFTGSKNHNIALRKIAISKGWKLSEYGLFKGQRTLASNTEEEIYAKLGLPYIEPEIREDEGEIQAALSKKLPTLIERQDLAGDLHVHSNWSDGNASIIDMAKAAQRAGLHYFCLTDHTGILKIAGGLSPAQFERQAQEIQKIQKQLKGITILQGCELNIKHDGSPDLPASTLKKLDIVVASIHHGLSQPKAKATARTIKAIENPHIDIIGHPTGRLISRREGYELDFDAVFEACTRHDKALEIDSIPERMDLTASTVRAAIKRGVAISISSDSHATDNFRFLDFGIFNARRGWCEKKDVINTWPIEKLIEWAKKHG